MDEPQSVVDLLKAGRVHAIDREEVPADDLDHDRSRGLDPIHLLDDASDPHVHGAAVERQEKGGVRWLEHEVASDAARPLRLIEQLAVGESDADQNQDHTQGNGHDVDAGAGRPLAEVRENQVPHHRIGPSPLPVGALNSFSTRDKAILSLWKTSIMLFAPQAGVQLGTQSVR